MFVCMLAAASMRRMVYTGVLGLWEVSISNGVIYG